LGEHASIGKVNWARNLPSLLARNPLVDPLILALSLFGLSVAWIWARKANRTSSPQFAPPLEALQDFIQPQGPFVGTLVIGVDHCVLGCNDAFCSFFSTNPKDVVGRRITSLFRKSLATRIETPSLLEHALTQGAALSGYSPLELNLVGHGRSEPLRLLHTTAFFKEGGLAGVRVEYFVDITEHSQEATLKTRSLGGDPLTRKAPRKAPAVDQDAIVHIDKLLCPTSITPGAVALLEEGVKEKGLLGQALSSRAGWLGDPTLLAEIRKALRGGGTAQIRRQLKPIGSWVDIFIAPTEEGVSLSLITSREDPSLPSRKARTEKQRDLFASLSPSAPSTPIRKTRSTTMRRKNRPSSRQTEFFFQPPAGPH
jgi:hypothetical protein